MLPKLETELDDQRQCFTISGFQLIPFLQCRCRSHSGGKCHWFSFSHWYRKGMFELYSTCSWSVCVQILEQLQVRRQLDSMQSFDLFAWNCFALYPPYILLMLFLHGHNITTLLTDYTSSRQLCFDLDGNTSNRQGFLRCASHFLFRALLVKKCVMQIRYEMVSNAHVHHVTLSLWSPTCHTCWTLLALTGIDCQEGNLKKDMSSSFLGAEKQ